MAGAASTPNNECVSELHSMLMPILIYSELTTRALSHFDFSQFIQDPRNSSMDLTGVKCFAQQCHEYRNQEEQ